MKNKHSLDPSGASFLQQKPLGQRGRGRPKKTFDFEKIDPTSDAYLNVEERRGGPIDPITGF
jgi:hypothetical protein